MVVCWDGAGLTSGGGAGTESGGGDVLSDSQATTGVTAPAITAPGPIFKAFSMNSRRDISIVMLQLDANEGTYGFNLMIAKKAYPGHVL